jgi:ABC-type lipoprotein release transport system permease subunit
MILIRPRVIVVVALSILIFTSTVSILSGLQSAPSSFAGDQGIVIMDSSAPTIFSSRVSMDIISALSSWSHPVKLSPEVFAFSTWGDVSFVLRGVDLDRFNSTGPAFVRFVLSGDRSPQDNSSAMIGSRLLGRLHVSFPFSMPLVGSYSNKMNSVHIIGWFETGTSLDDEMFVSLEVARQLSGMSEGDASIIRVDTPYGDELRELLSPEHPRFVLYDLWQSKSMVAVNDTIGISVSVRNWGRAAGNITVTFSDERGFLGNVDVALEGLSSTGVCCDFAFNRPYDVKRIQASIGGDFPANLSATFKVVEPFLVVSARSVAVLGTDIEVKVTDYTGESVPNATVQFQGNNSTTNSSGLATVKAAEVASSELTASSIGYVQASVSVEVLDPSAVTEAFLPVVSSLEVNPSVTHEAQRTTGTAVVMNEGNLSGTFETGIYLDGSLYATTSIFLGPLDGTILTIDLGGQSVGSHVVQVGSFAAGFDITPWYADNSGLVRLILKYGGSTSISSAGSIPIYQAAKISEGNVAVTLFSVGAISALLAALAIAAVFSKEVRESRRRLGVLRTIGAPRGAISRMVFPQALEAGLGGAAVGVALGIIIVDRLSSSGAFMLFGHGLRIDIDTTLMLLIMLSAVLISVFSAMASTMQAVRETTISSIRSLAEEPSGQVEVNYLLRDD